MKLRIIVSGMVAQYPVGGVVWDYLPYVIGLAQLGHEVYYHEDTWNWPYDPVRATASASGDYSAGVLRSFFDRYAPELAGQWHYDHLHQENFGMTREAFGEVAATTDLFINVSGASAIPDELRANCVKVFLDSDPGYNQIMLIEKFSWSENVDRWCELVANHDRHFTYAENIGFEDCLVPTAGYSWIPTRMPVVTSLWSKLASQLPAANAPWTTVMTWNNFKGPLIYGNVEYKGKGAEFEKIIDLPKRTPHPFCVAVGGTKAPLRRLKNHAWNPVDGPKATLTPELYQEFIGNSRGEVSTAKHVYAELRSGWFSCRSACYLSAGRPAVIQDTGFSRVIPCGRGLLAFESVEEAAEQIRSIEADFVRHATAAREVACEYFEATKVLAELVERAME